MRNITGHLFGFFLTFLFCVLIIAIPVSCSGTDCKDPKNATSAACVAKEAAVTCTGGDVTGAITKYTPAVESIIQSGLNPDGSVNWDSILGKLEKAAIDFGQCVVADVFGKYVFSKAAPVPGKPATQPSSAAAREGFDKLRAKIAPGKTFETSSGTL